MARVSSTCLTPGMLDGFAGVRWGTGGVLEIRCPRCNDWPPVDGFRAEAGARVVLMATCRACGLVFER